MKARWSVWLIITVLVGGAAAVLTPYFMAQTERPAPSTASPAASVLVARPERKTLIRTITLPGDIRPYQEAAVYAKVSGYLKWISVDRGDRVKAGQAIGVLEIPEMEREYRRAEANMAMKEKIAGRLADIRKQNRDLIALEEVEQAWTDFEMAKAARDELTSKMDYATIRAPFEGVVTTRYVHPGTLIQAGTSAQTQSSPIVAVMDLNRLRITVAVPESEVAWITPATHVQITVDARPGESYGGTVTRFSQSLDPTTRTMLTEIAVGNPGRHLYPGMFAHVIFTLETRSDRLTVPRQAVQGTGKDLQVLMVESGRVKAVAIRKGYEDASIVEVTEGLSGTEQVIVQSRQRVRPGDLVTVRGATP